MEKTKVNMKEKIRKLFRGTREDQIIACNLLCKNYFVPEFLEQWIIEDKDVSFWTSREHVDRTGLIFREKISEMRWEFYYHYGSHRWLLCCNTQIIVCHQRYNKRVEKIEHK